MRVLSEVRTIHMNQISFGQGRAELRGYAIDMGFASTWNCD